MYNYYLFSFFFFWDFFPDKILFIVILGLKNVRPEKMLTILLFC